MLSYSVDLFIYFSSVVITALSDSRYCESYSCWMPSSDTSNSSPSSMCFLLQVLDTESLDGSASSFTFSDTDDVDVLVLLEDLIDLDFLFEEFVAEVNFLSDCSTIDLNFEDVVLLLSEVQFIELGVSDDSDDCAIFLDSVELDLDRLRVFSDFLLIFREGLLL